MPVGALGVMNVLDWWLCGGMMAYGNTSHGMHGVGGSVGNLRKLTVNLSPQEVDILREACKRLGIVNDRGGKMHQTGNISGLLHALAVGRGVSSSQLFKALREARELVTGARPLPNMPPEPELTP